MARLIEIGIIGDFDPANATHVATNTAIEHASQSLGRKINAVWLPTDQPQQFDKYDALFCSPGSPYRDMEGALLGIQYAREHKIPFMGTCGGFQHLVIEYARNILGIREAAHAETDPYASCLFITPLSCSLVGKSMDVNLKPNGKAAAAYQTTHATENYYCNFGLNPVHQQRLEQAGLNVTGTDSDGEVRIMELPSQPFFLGTLFVPQARSTAGNPHPLILSYCRAAMSD